MSEIGKYIYTISAVYVMEMKGVVAFYFDSVDVLFS